MSRSSARFLAKEETPGSWHIGGLLRVGPPVDGGVIDVETIRRHVAARIGIDPRLRQRLGRAPYGLGTPVWVDDPEFDLDRHVLPVDGGEGADDQRLLELVGDVISRPLDVHRPLWTMHVVSPLADGGAAILSRFHHAVADGMKGVALAAGMLLDQAPDAAPEPPAPWTPRPRPSDRELLLEGFRARLGSAGPAAASALKEVAEAARRGDRPSIERTWDALRRAPGTFRREWLGRAPTSPLEGALGKRRALALASLPLDDVKSLENAFGRHVTVNDICLSAFAGAIGRWMAAEGLAVQEVVVKIPVVPHTQVGGMATRTGRGSFEFVPLPVGISDPVERLLEVGARTHDSVRQGDVAETRTIEGALAHLPHAFAALAEDRLASPAHFNVAVTNVPGPAQRFYVAGGEVLVAVPMPHLWGAHLIHVGILSLSGTLTIALVADPEHLPDPQLIADDATDELEALLARA